MGRRRAGPPVARSVRRAGDEAMSELLAAALVMDGAVERATHGFHTYPARMHPDAAAALIAACPGPVHDPFCGGGTVLVEGLLAGRETTGTDLSPIAVLVSGARTAPLELVTPMRSAARKITEAARLRVDVEVPELAERWFSLTLPKNWDGFGMALRMQVRRSSRSCGHCSPASSSSVASERVTLRIGARLITEHPEPPRSSSTRRPESWAVG